MLQIAGLRPYNDSKGRKKKRPILLERNLGFDSIEQVFDKEKVESLLASIPEKERYDLYFTVSDCHKPMPDYRKFREQWVVHFDIDYIDRDKAEEVAKAACEALTVDYNKTGVVFSGNGVQIFVRVRYPITNPSFFDETRAHYSLMTKKINAKLESLELKGNSDSSVWSAARLMRLPWTENRKFADDPVQATVLQDNIEIQDFDIVALANIKETSEHPSDIITNHGPIDSGAVLTGCDFIKWSAENQNQVTEPQWYAMLSVVARTTNGADICHRYSEKHKDYVYEDTEDKVRQAIEAAGPRTCANISSLWDGCNKCPHYGKVKSPIQIKGPDFLGSKDYGFRYQVQDKSGAIKPGAPHYDDLVRHFDQTFRFITQSDTGDVWVFNGKFYKIMDDLAIRNWANDLIIPAPSSFETKELLQRIKQTRTKPNSWFYDTCEGMINFKNGVLRLSNLELVPHDPQYGFTYELPYDYNQRASAPRFNVFMQQIFSDDQQVVEMVKAYIGYALSNDECWLQRALFLIGDGANGKSVLFETIGALVGQDNHSTVAVQDLENANSRARLVHKLFNYSEETSGDALTESEQFKLIVAGGSVTYKHLYKDESQIVLRTKMMMSSNHFPLSKDKSFGLERRLLLVPMTARFTDENRDPFLNKKLKEELAGIFNDCMDKYQKIKAAGKINIPDKVRDSVNNFKFINDVVYQFSQERLQIAYPDDRPKVTGQMIYDEYRNFCTDHGIKNIMTKGKLFLELPRVLNGQIPTYRPGKTGPRYYLIKIMKGDENEAY